MEPCAAFALIQTMPAPIFSRPPARRALFAVLLLCAACVVLSLAAGAWLRARTLHVLGDHSELGLVYLGLDGAVVLRGLRVPSPTTGWPEQADALRVGYARVHPRWGALLRGEVRIRAIDIDDGYLSVLRSADQGLRVLPTILQREVEDRARRAWDGSAEIEHVEIRDSTLDFYDAKVRQPPLKLRVEHLGAQLQGLRVPQMTTPVQVDVGGRVRGAAHDGALAIRGWINLHTRDSALDIELRGLDLVAVEPYVVRSPDIGVQSGVLDLQMRSEVQARQLDAPGSLRLSQLEFVAGEGLQGTFMGTSRIALLKFMEERQGELALDFRLRGSLDDPKFTLEEALPLRIAVGVAEVLGVSVKGVVSGVGTLGGKGLEAVGDAAKGIGKLFGMDDAKPDPASAPTDPR